MADSRTPPSSAEGGALDWSELLARFDRLSQAQTEQDARDQFDRRTRELAQPESGSHAVEQVELIAFGRGGLRYAVPVEHAQAVAPLRHLLTLPGVDTLHVGVMAHDGRLYAIIDPAVLTEQVTPAATAPAFAVLLRHATHAIGLAADTVSGVMRVDAALLNRISPHYSLVATILPGGEHVLSPDDIGRNVRLIVDHRQHDGTLS